jgi:hypothetical protein
LAAFQVMGSVMIEYLLGACAAALAIVFLISVVAVYVRSQRQRY